MKKQSANELRESPGFRALVARRWAVSISLTAAMFIAYFGFVLVLAFHKESLAVRIGEHVTIGIPIGIGVILFAWVLTGIYVWWANGRYDRAVHELKSQLRS